MDPGRYSWAMDLYGRKEASTGQKVLIVAAEVAWLAVSYAVLFGSRGGGTRALTLFAFNLAVFTRFLATLVVFLRRRIPWEEAFSVCLAFGLYMVGFPLLARPGDPFWGAELAGIVLFLAGSLVNTLSEYQRHRFKARSENRGRLYTGGLFSASMHVNYFGDLAWITGYACVTGTVWAFAVPVLLFVFFWFYNIPKLDAHLEERYGEEFREYRRRTRRLIPYLL